MLKLPRPIQSNSPLTPVINEIIRAMQMFVPMDGRNTTVRRSANGFSIDVKNSPPGRKEGGGSSGSVIARWQ